MGSASALSTAAAIIARHSKSFALASKLLPPGAREDAIVLYAYCRRVDDAIDSVAANEQAHALIALRVELASLYAGAPQPDPLLAALQSVIEQRAIPRFCFDDLLLGMEMDVRDTAYTSVAELLLYCYRVAGTVGLMMCHVMGVRDRAALEHAKDLGSAMQLTNIARDVLEDWQRGRLYLPNAMLAVHGASGLRDQLGHAFPESAAPAVSHATADLLALADGYYRSGDAGLRYLSFRCASAVYAARLVYSSIGTVLRRRGCHPLAGRAIVAKHTKLMLAGRALLTRAFAAIALLFVSTACAHPQQLEHARPQQIEAPAATRSEAAQRAPAAPATAPTRAPAAPIAPSTQTPTATPATQPATQPATAAPAPQDGRVVVDISGLRSTDGQLLVALFRSSKGFPGGGAKAFGKRVAKPRASRARIVFDEVPPGPFAVTVHHDANKNFAMEKNLMGMPEEGYGFSRDASAPFGPPDFNAAKLTLGPSETKRISIHLRH